jgi:hypothetical protein
MKIVLAVVCIVLVCNVAFAIDGWKGPGKVLSVMPAIFLTGDIEGGYPIIVKTDIPVPDCNGSNWWAIRGDLDDKNRLYSAVLTALATAKDVQLYQWSCYRVSGIYYGKIGAIEVQQ